MEKIKSFVIDHLKLNKGVYVSRVDIINDEKVTTYDLRMKKPYKEEVLDTGTIHALEHLGATYLRNYDEIKNEVIYFGPMGCRTGFYLILKGNLSSRNIVPYLKKMFIYIAQFNDIIPGASQAECGNYEDMNLAQAKVEALKYLDVLENIKRKNLLYPNEYFNNDEELISFLLNKEVEVTIDRPIGYIKNNITYTINYGFIDDITMLDNGYLDVYILGESKPIIGNYIGKVIAGIKREDDIEFKLVVSNIEYTDEEIKEQVNFIEKYFISNIIR